MTTRLFLFLLALMTGGSAMALEEPEYAVLFAADGYEVRDYEPYVVAEVDIHGPSADGRGFRTLAGYIFGDNQSGEKMQMTAPVESHEAGDSDGITYAFVMESKYTMETLPAPNNREIRIREKPRRVVAAMTFSGRWTEKNINRHKQRFLADLAADGIEPVGTVELARYNSPFTPWFLRRNELIVPVSWPSTTP